MTDILPDARLDRAIIATGLAIAAILIIGTLLMTGLV
jgi:hypothetical protein